MRKVASEEGLDQRAEDNLCAAGLGEGHPDDEDELERVVECFWGVRCLWRIRDRSKETHGTSRRR